MSIGQTHSITEIRTAIRELSLRADLARKEGRPDDASEIEQRIAKYRDELAARPEPADRSRRQAPSLRNVLRWNTIGATSALTVMSLTRSTTMV